MERILAFAIVALIGYAIMVYDKSKPDCFKWCDVGKGLLMWATTELTVYLIKGKTMSVRMSGGSGRSIMSHVTNI